jgi:hypothetical protein
VKMGWSCLDGRCVDEKKKEGREMPAESLFVRLRSRELSAVLTSFVSLCKAVTTCDD